MKSRTLEDIKNIVIETLDSIQSYQDRISVEEIPANYKVECSELDHSAGVIRRRYVEYCA